MSTRFDLPENFYDITSSMLLVQPQPQFLFAQLWKSAMAASIQVPESIGMSGREISSGGAPYVSETKDRLQMANELLGSLIAAKFDMKGQVGHTVRVNRPKYALTTYTKASRVVDPSSTISTVPVKVQSEQTDITIRRYAGPYDQANSRVAPYFVDRLDASMGVHKISQLIGNAMREDFDRFIDTTLITLANNAATTFRPAGMTADNDATAVNQFPLDYDTINRAEADADENNLPVFPDGYRLLVVTPTQARQLKNDSQFAKYAEHHPEYNALFPGYIKSVNRLHVMKCTTLDKSVNSSSVAIHKGLLLSPGVWLSAMGEKPRVATSSDDNYAEQAKLIWIAYFENELADNRFTYSIRTSA